MIILDCISIIVFSRSKIIGAVALFSFAMITSFFNEAIYEEIKDFQVFLSALLGFTLASFTLFLSNENKIKELKEFKTKREINGRVISLYRLIVIEFCSLLVLETTICGAYYTARLVAPLVINLIPDILIGVGNAFYIFAFIICLYLIINTISDIYNISSKE